MSLREDQQRFFGKLAAMMEAEVPLLKAFEVAGAGVHLKEFRESLERILTRAYGGTSLTDAMEEEGAIFSPEIMCLIRHGEAAGDLERKSAAIARGLAEGVFEAGELSEGAERDLLDELLAEAGEAGAGDVHLEPVEGGAALRFRIDGRLETVRTVSHAEAGVLLVLAKRRAGLDASIVSAPQEGRIDLVKGRVRISTCPFLGGEGMVLRLLSGPPAADLGVLGIDPERAALVESWLRSGHGLVLTVSPPAGGRLEAIEAMVARLDAAARKVIVVDRRARLSQPGLETVAPRPEEGFTEAEALEAALGQDPDVLVVPEATDLETAEEALRGALTGHLVLLGLDAGSSSEALEMLADAGVPANRLAETLLGVTAHRRLDRADGAGRVPIAEILPASPDVREALRADEAVPVAIPTLFEEADRLVKAGVVAARERERVLG